VSPPPARRFAPRLVAFGNSIVPLRVAYSPPEINGWIKPWSKAKSRKLSIKIRFKTHKIANGGDVGPSQFFDALK